MSFIFSLTFLSWVECRRDNNASHQQWKITRFDGRVLKSARLSSILEVGEDSVAYVDMTGTPRWGGPKAKEPSDSSCTSNNTRENSCDTNSTDTAKLTRKDGEMRSPTTLKMSTPTQDPKLTQRWQPRQYKSSSASRQRRILCRIQGRGSGPDDPTERSLIPQRVITAVNGALGESIINSQGRLWDWHTDPFLRPFWHMWLVII